MKSSCKFQISKKKIFRVPVMILLMSMLFAFIYSLPVNAEASGFDFWELKNLDERKEDFFSMQDLDTKEIIMRTARIMHEGDEYINQKNYLYRVENIDENIAWARNLGKIKLSDLAAEEVIKSFLEQFSGFREAQEPPPDPIIGIYHSHGAESYVPSDGSESIDGGGGILEVGKTFARALEQRGLNVNYSSRTHVPHDAGAYQRSRRTVEDLMRNASDALFDVHRDAVPAEEYTAVVNGEEKVQIQFVVGRQNPNSQVNREYAESLKQFVDNQTPGLIKGIFMSNGSYNQDMLPLSLLLEVGTHENTREGAEDSMQLFADPVQFYFLGNEGAAARGGIALTALRVVLWLILITAVAAGIYILLSTGSREEARDRIIHFFKKEFAEFGKKNRGGEESGGK